MDRFLLKIKARSLLVQELIRILQLPGDDEIALHPCMDILKECQAWPCKALMMADDSKNEVYKPGSIVTHTAIEICLLFTIKLPEYQCKELIPKG